MRAYAKVSLRLGELKGGALVQARRNKASVRLRLKGREQETWRLDERTAGLMLTWGERTSQQASTAQSRHEHLAVSEIMTSGFF